MSEQEKSSQRIRWMLKWIFFNLSKDKKVEMFYWNLRLFKAPKKRILTSLWVLILRKCFLDEVSVWRSDVSFFACFSFTIKSMKKKWTNRWAFSFSFPFSQWFNEFDLRNTKKDKERKRKNKANLLFILDVKSSRKNEIFSLINNNKMEEKVEFRLFRQSKKSQLSFSPDRRTFLSNCHRSALENVKLIVFDICL